MLTTGKDENENEPACLHRKHERMRMRLHAYIGNRIGSRQRVMKVSSGRQRVNKW